MPPPNKPPPPLPGAPAPAFGRSTPSSVGGKPTPSMGAHRGLPPLLNTTPSPSASGPPKLPPRPPGLIMAIAAGQIENIQAMSPGHPVWEVTMKGGKKLVVKSENIASTSKLSNPRDIVDEKKRQYAVQQNARMGVTMPAMTAKNVQAINAIMGEMSPGHEQTPLSDSEIAALAAFKAAPEDLGDYIQQARSKRQILLKMKHDPGFTTLGKASERSLDPKDKASLNDLVLALVGNEQAWVSLGKISIADAFVGNNDRLDFANRVVGNAGNVIFHRTPDGKITHAKGLDTLDPSASDSGHMYGTDIKQWTNNFGQYIKDKSTFPSLTQAILDNFNRTSLTPLGITNLGPAEAGALARGMSAGWDQLANRINGLAMAHKKVPSGVMSRAVYLGWVK